MNGLLLFSVTIMLAFACLSGRKNFDAVTIDNERFQLINDTLYSSTDMKFFAGQ